MASRKLSRGGNQKGVRSRSKPRVRSEQIELKKYGDEIGAREEPANLSVAYELLTGFSSDFFKGGRGQPKLDKRLGR